MSVGYGMQNLNVFVLFYENLRIFTRDELREYYEVTNREFYKEDKEYLNKELGTSFIKKQDFSEFILLKLQQQRNTRKTFDENDLSFFIKLTNGIPSQYKKLYEYLKREPIEFVYYLRDYYDDIINRNNYKKLAKEGMFQAKTVLKNYENITNFIKESQKL